MKKAIVNEMGESLLEIKVNKQIYYKKLLTLFIVCNALLLGAFIFLNIVLKNWVAILVSALIFSACVVTSVFNIKTSLKNVKYEIFNNYLVVGMGDNKLLFCMSDYVGIKKGFTLSDTLFGKKTYCLNLFFNHKSYKRLYLNNIDDNYDEIYAQLEIARQSCKIESQVHKIQRLKKEKKTVKTIKKQTDSQTKQIKKATNKSKK